MNQNNYPSVEIKTSYITVNNLLLVINSLSTIHQDVNNLFTKGYCGLFHIFLKKLRPDAEMYYNSDHVITKIEDRYFDITGEISLSTVIKDNYLHINMFGENHHDNLTIR